MNQEITSFDAAKPGVFGDILTLPATPPSRLKVGLLGAGYFEYWRMYPALRAQVEADLAGVQQRLARRLDLVYPGLVDTLDRAEEAGRAFAAAGVAVVIVVDGTYLPDFYILHALEHVPQARLILFNTQTGNDLSPTDNYPATMRNSALIGIAQLTGTFRKARRAYEVVVGEIADDAAYDQIARLVQAQAIVRRLRTFNIGLIGHVFRGMFDLEFDRGAVRGQLGPEVITVQAEHLVDIWREIPEPETKAATAALMQRFRTRQITGEDVERSVRLGLAMRQLARTYRLDGLCFLGQHYLEKMTGAPARIGGSMLLEQDQMMVACEGDIGGLIMMAIMHALTGHAPVQMEWGQFDLRHNAIFLLGHGIVSPELATDPSQVTLTAAPEEWGFQGHGVNWELIIRPGPVTLGHFLSTPEGWQMMISEGEALPFPCLPCQEIHALVRVATPVREYLQQLLRAGITHHAILVHGRIAGDLAAIADLLGVRKLVA